MNKGKLLPLTREVILIKYIWLNSKTELKKKVLLAHLPMQLDLVDF